MIALCQIFRSDGRRFCRGSIPSKSCIGAYVFRRMDGVPHSNAASVGLRTFSMGNNIGKVLSVIISQWLNVSGTT